MLHTIDQARRANERAGQNWFAPDTMRWWHCRLLHASVAPVADGILFVTSNDPFDTGRRYTVHFCSDDGQMAGVDAEDRSLCLFPTADHARFAMRRLAREWTAYDPAAGITVKRRQPNAAGAR